MKLGEILVKARVLTEGQLEKALSSQLIVGGHLGTRLIEMGFVDEDTLGKVLSKMSGVPYAPPELFANIPPATIKSVPLKVAEWFQVVPLKLADQAVHLALVNPRDLRVLDELSFAIGRKIIPWIAPEVRIFEALEKYYAVGRRPRYIALGHQLDEAGVRNRSKTPINPQAVDAAEPIVEADSSRDEFLSGPEENVEVAYSRPWQEIADEIERGEQPSVSMPLSELAERYCRADSHDDLARAVFEFGAGRAERMLFMTVRADRASAWHERGLALPDETRGRVSFQVTSEALFGLLMGDDHFHGDLPPREEIHSFYRRLEVDAPLQILMIPIRINDRLVAVFLADGGPLGRIQGDAEDFLKALRLFGMSLGLLGLRKKIRDAARPVARAIVVAAEPADIP